MTRPPNRSGKARQDGRPSGPRRRGDGPSGRRGDEPGRLRLFYAVFVPRDLREELRHSQRLLRGDYWKKVHPDQFHVTLLFLGSVASEELERVRQAGAAVASQQAPFAARLRGTGFFPNEGSPRVWFAKAEGEGFAPLAAALTERLGNGESEDFKAHVTLARKKGPAARPGPVVFNLDWEVASIDLVRSVLLPAGPAYQVLESFPLSGSPREAPGSSSQQPEASNPSSPREDA
ncbi:MAG TPA: RNA 2',3'-cyclic phosphodiesterase [Deinococcales bacterium]|nr:RNA 2',3'-cyclic phosphodiesterase [Deinococcales bacterium]